MTNNQSRRRFIKLTVAGAAAAPLAASLLNRPAAAQGQEKISLDDPTAQSLGYVHDASNVDKGKYPQFQPSQNCANCQLYLGNASTDGEGEWGGCGIFGGRLVNAQGWCAAWVKKAG